MNAFAIIELGVLRSRLGCWIPEAGAGGADPGVPEADSGIKESPTPALAPDTVSSSSSPEELAQSYFELPEGLDFPLAQREASTWCFGAQAQGSLLDDPQNVVYGLDHGPGERCEADASMWPFAAPLACSHASEGGELWRVGARHYRRAFLWSRFFSEGRRRLQREAGRLLHTLVVVIGPEWSLQMRRDARQGALAAGFERVSFVDRALACMAAGASHGDRDWELLGGRLSPLLRVDAGSGGQPWAAGALVEREQEEVNSVISAAQMAVDETLAVLQAESAGDVGSPSSQSEKGHDATRVSAADETLEDAETASVSGSDEQAQDRSLSHIEFASDPHPVQAETDGETDSEVDSDEEPDMQRDARLSSDAASEDVATRGGNSSARSHILLFALESALDMVWIKESARSGGAPKTLEIVDRKLYRGLGEASWNGRFVQAIAEMIEAPSTEPSAQLCDDPVAQLRLWDLSAKVRQRLDLRGETEVHLPYLWAEKPWSTQLRWTRRRFESLIEADLETWRSDLRAWLESLADGDGELVSMSLCGPFCATPVFQRNLSKLRDSGSIGPEVAQQRLEDPQAAVGARLLVADDSPQEGSAIQSEANSEVEVNMDSRSPGGSWAAAADDKSEASGLKTHSGFAQLYFCHQLVMEHEDGPLLWDEKPPGPGQVRQYHLPIIDTAREGKAQRWRLWECWYEGPSLRKHNAGELWVKGHASLAQTPVVLRISRGGQWDFDVPQEAKEAGMTLEYKQLTTLEPQLTRTLRNEEAQADYRLQVSWQRESLRTHLQDQLPRLSEEALQGHKMDDLLRDRIRAWRDRVNADPYFVKSDQRDGEESLDQSLRELAKELQDVYEQLTPAHHKSLKLRPLPPLDELVAPPKLRPEERYPFDIVIDEIPEEAPSGDSADESKEQSETQAAL